MASPTAVVIIDMQNDVVGGKVADWSPPIGGIVSSCVRLIGRARSQSIPVVYTAVEYKADGSNTPTALATGVPTSYGYLIEGTPGVAVIDQLAPATGELVAIKNLVSGFEAKGVPEHLQRLGVETILLCGLAIEHGVLQTAQDAVARGMGVILVSDCCGGFSQESYDHHLESVYPPIATVCSLEQALSE